MATLEELRAMVTGEQGPILNTIWRDFTQSESWIRAGVLYSRLGKGQDEQAVNATLAPLGGTIVYETADTGAGPRYGLTFLGVLLTDQGREIESVLAKAFARIRDLFLENPDGRMNLREVAKDLGLDEVQTTLFLKVFLICGFFGGGDNFESAGWPQGIDKLVHVDDFEAHIREVAMRGYDPSVPVDSDPVSRSLYESAVKRKRQSMAANDQFGHGSTLEQSQAGPEVRIESSGSGSFAAQNLYNSTVIFNNNAGDGAGQGRTPTDEFRHRTAQTMRRVRMRLTGTEDFHPRPEIDKIEEQFRARKAVILYGEAGSGKSAIGGRLAAAAFDRKGVLLLDARNVADFDEMKLRSHFGSLRPLGEVIGEIGRDRGFRLIIDQLDNLIDSSAADLLIDLALECQRLDGVEVIVISRAGEEHEDRRLQPLTDAGFVKIESQRLRDEEVVAILEKVGITAASPELVRLGRNFLHLEIICVIKQKQPDFTFAAISDEIALWDEFVKVFRGREEVGGRREPADRLIGTAMELARKCLISPTMSVETGGPLPPAESRLESWNIIIAEEEFIYRFKHEKFQDYLYARWMCGNGEMPEAVLTEIDRHRARGILRLMSAKYKADKSARLEPFLRKTLLSAETPFFAQTAVLSHYLQAVLSVEDVEALKVIIEVFNANSHLREWFFRNRPSPLWAPILLATGFLDEAPAPVETEGGYQLRNWDAQEYLISVARDFPQLVATVVLDHFERLKGHPRYFERAVDALKLIPVKEADKAVPALLGKLTDPEFARAVGEDVFELMTAMAKEGLTETAFALFEALTVPQPSSKVWEYKSLPNVFFNAEAVSLLSTKEYYHQRFWRPAVNELARLDLERLVAELERLLLRTLRMEAETGNRGDEFERSSMWRNAIEETGQDHGEEYKDLLTELLRDNLNLLVGRLPAAAEAIVDRYLDHDVEILRRLGLYLLWSFPAQFRAQVNEELFDPENLDDLGIHHEYFMLLRSGYPQLDSEEKARLEQMILEGPGAAKLKKAAEWANTERGADPETYAEGYRKHWVQRRLWMIREHLTGKVSAELQLLTDELGEPDHPAFTHWSSGVRAISSVSPRSVEELREMAPDSLIGYLRDWTHGVRDYSRGVEESIEALSREVAETVLFDLDRYGDYAQQIARLRPIYAAALINQYFGQGTDQDTVRRLRLSLIVSLLADETIRRDMRDDGAGWVTFRYAAVGYVQGLMEREGWQVPADELPILRDILITLVDDSDPESGADRAQEDWTEHNDPLTVAINHVRPKALSALINYACYVARQGEGEDRKGFGPKRLELMIERTLTGKLDWRSNPSLSVHSIFGRLLNQLCWLDLEWAKTHLDDIFPAGEEGASTAFFDTAWRSFVTSRQGVYAPVFDLLREKYDRAIERLKTGWEANSRFNPMESFASHLIVEYLYADYELHPAGGRQSLVVKFFNEMPADARELAVWRIAPEYRNSKKDEHLAVKHWRRIRALWEWRLNEATLMGFPGDFKGEMEGFSDLLDELPEQENLDSMWLFLEGMLHYVEQHDALWRNLEEYLSRAVNDDPVRAIRLFGSMQDRLDRSLRHYSDEARTILEVGAARAESKPEALLLLERIAKGGYYGFNPLYDKYAGRQ